MIGKSACHLQKFKKVLEMANLKKTEKYKDWSFDNLSWNLGYLDYSYCHMVNRKGMINKIKAESQDCEAFVIAGDNDPSGEGDLLQWEIINWIGWKKPVYRMYFSDSGIKEVQEAYDNMVLIDNTDKAYIRARNRKIWDFLSQQVTEALNIKMDEFQVRFKPAVRKKGLEKTLLRSDRLKSSIIRKVGDRYFARLNYKKAPFFENQFYEEETGLVFSRKFKEGDTWRLKSVEEAQNESISSTDRVGDVVQEEGIEMPPALLNGEEVLSLADKGYSATAIPRSLQKLKD